MNAGHPCAVASSSTRPLSCIPKASTQSHAGPFALVIFARDRPVAAAWSPGGAEVHAATKELLEQVERVGEFHARAAAHAAHATAQACLAILVVNGLLVVIRQDLQPRGTHLSSAGPVQPVHRTYSTRRPRLYHEKPDGCCPIASGAAQQAEDRDHGLAADGEAHLVGLADLLEQVLRPRLPVHILQEVSKRVNACSLRWRTRAPSTAQRAQTSADGPASPDGICGLSGGTPA